MSFSLSRRALLAAIPAGLRAAPPRLSLGCQTNSWPIDPKNLATFQGALEHVKSFDFVGFETGFGNVQQHFGSVAEVRSTIAKTGLRFLGVHIFLTAYDPRTCVAPADLWRSVVDGSTPLGAERLILSGATAAPGGKLDSAALERKCNELNAAAKYAGEKGMRFAYHNHGPEFASGAAEIEGLMAGTDPKLVDFLLDSGHARRQKADVPGFLVKHHVRIFGIHLRDLSDRPGENPELGPFDLHGLAVGIQKAKWNGWLIVEEENAVGKSGDDAVRPARQTLRQEFHY